MVAAKVDVDLDDLKAKRLEVAEERTVRFGGKVWKLVPELPFEVGELHRRGARRAVLALLLADPGPRSSKDKRSSEERHEDAVDAFMALGPSEPDVGALVLAYGVTQGE